MPRIAARGDIGQGFLVHTIRTPAPEHEAAVAVAAVDVAVLVDLEPDLGVAERGGAIVGTAANVGRAVAPYAAGFDEDGLGRGDAHGDGR